MISLYKSFHTFLRLPDRGEKPPPKIPYHRPDSGLRHLIDDPSPPAPDRGDPGGWGLHEALALGPALGLCTESLGSESCDTGVVEEIAARSPKWIGKSRRREAESASAFALASVTREETKERKFPPPLRWLSETRGRRSCCFMKGEKRDGRFVLKEVRIERAEVLIASRQNGRLRLKMIEYNEYGVKEEDERVEMLGPVGVMRCQDTAVVGDGTWWRGNNHRYVTTA